VRRHGTFLLGLLATLVLATTAPAQSLHGKLSGIVVDPQGVPQMGATVTVLPEADLAAQALTVVTNDRGLFSAASLRPGLYTVRVTLAGFLPAIERHIRIEADLTTLLKIQLDSVFSSIERLRERPAVPIEPDEWAWILRTSAATRPVLRLADGELVVAMSSASAETKPQRRPHGRLELTSGARRAGSPSNVVDAPGTAFAYQQSLGHTGRLLLSGQASFEHSAAAGFAAVWMPQGERGEGPQTTLVLRQADLGRGLRFRGARAAHRSELALGERLSLHYGAEFLLVGMGETTSSLRPFAELVYALTPNWRAALIFAARPWAGAGRETDGLESALEQLDAFPAVMLRDGRPVVEGGQHAELAVEHLLGPNTSVVASVFRDQARHTAVFGRGRLSDPDFLQDNFSTAFVYDGGAVAGWGTRLVLRHRFGENAEANVIYAWASALSPTEDRVEGEVRDSFVPRHRHSLAARLSARFESTGTRLSASYKWVGGTFLTRPDAYGEVVHQVEPFLTLTVRQPLPFTGGRFEALADFRNLLAEGYVPITTPDGRILLIPALRSFRTGVSFQF